MADDPKTVGECGQGDVVELPGGLVIHLMTPLNFGFLFRHDIDGRRDETSGPFPISDKAPVVERIKKGGEESNSGSSYDPVRDGPQNIGSLT